MTQRLFLQWLSCLVLDHVSASSECELFEEELIVISTNDRSSRVSPHTQKLKRTVNLVKKLRPGYVSWRTVTEATEGRKMSLYFTHNFSTTQSKLLAATDVVLTYYGILFPRYTWRRVPPCETLSSLVFQLQPRDLLTFHCRTCMCASIHSVKADWKGS